MELEKRKYIIYTVCFTILALFVVRLAYLQLFSSDELTKESNKNSIKTITITPPRGIMYDRNGKVLVDNKPSYTVTITPNSFDKNNLAELSSVLEISADTLEIILKSIKGTNRFNPAKIKRDADFRIISYIAENRDRLNGVDYQVEAIRFYPNNFFGSHAFGYCNEISPKKLEAQMGDYYKQGDMIGSNGLESNYENYLRGVKGYKFITVDVKGRELGGLNDGNSDIQPVNGSDLILGMDKDLQEYAEKLISGKQGAIIAVDPRNGEILCFVSKPDFDLSAFAGKTDSKVFSSLLQDPQKPLFNRVVQTKYPPGSTWKMMMSLAALDAGIITTTSTIACPGSFTYGNRSFADHGAYGAINVVRALEVSANVFYYKLGLQVGIDNYYKYGKMLGFGSKTGIDIPNETNGLLPSREYFDKRYGENKWTQGFLVSLGIGQGELGVSPVQMVAYTAAIAMNGLYCQPHFVSKVRNAMTNQEEPVRYEQKRIDLPLKYYEAVKKGMYLVVNGNGTATAIKSPSVVLSGKTGTAQNSSGKNHSWFVGFAPYDDPKIAICVLGEFEGWGSSFGAPTAGALMLKYLGVAGDDPINDIKMVNDGSYD
ncbi:MAG TPA: penicillin-binding protein 2 [Ignavibacteria bacterium]|nr:penicillin-binding protein 2 [Ignavibacteria bacterium]